MYKIISASSIKELEEKVNEAVGKGYIVVGEITHIKELDQGNLRIPRHYSGLIVLMKNQNK